MRLLELLGVFLSLGLTSFGGPVAHLGYFQREFVEKRGWLSSAQFAEVVALAQLLPGPSSSQVNLCIGYLRAGTLGALLAWAGFTLPSVLALAAFAAFAVQGGALEAGWLAGLKAAAVAVVAHALAGLWDKLIGTPTQAALALGVAALLVLWPVFGTVLGLPTALGQVLALLVGGVVGWFWLAGEVGGAEATTEAVTLSAPSTRTGALLLAAVPLGLLALPALAGSFAAESVAGDALRLFADTFRAGALVFGGGHVVLPLLEGSMVPQWVSRPEFLAGYGAANAVPGPLFTFASYLGAVQTRLPAFLGTTVATLGIFLPGALLMLGALSFWQRLRVLEGAGRVLAGLNAAVIGLLLAALYDPVFTAGITGAPAFAVALLAYAALGPLRLPSWAVVGAAALVGWVAL